MKYNVPFRATYRVNKVISDRALHVELLDTEDFDCEVKDTTLYCKFKRVYEGDEFVSDCYFKPSENTGYYMKTDGLPIIKMPATEEDLAKHVASQIKGLSKATILKVIKQLGTDFIGKVNEDPLSLNKIELKKIQKKAIAEWCEAHYNLNAVIGEGYLRGLSPYEIFSAYKRYGSRVVRILQKDPYAIYLAGLVPFAKSERIAKKENYPADSKESIAAQAYKVIEEYEEAGSMALTKESLYEQIKKQLDVTDEQISESITYLRSMELIDEAEFDDAIFYGKRDNLQAERYIADFINEIKDEPFFSRGEIDEHFEIDGMNEQQIAAVMKCLQKRISLLVGGPGTGKTYTIKRIINLVKRIRPATTIALMAPTGKAASRMIEMIGMTATTIHAALGIAEGDDLMHKDGMKLEKDLVIVDEASMIDEKLFSYFVRHVGKNTQIILVGDTGQLPSVDAGNLLYELSKLITKAELTKICRQDKMSPIVLNAHHIRNREFDKIEFDDKEFKFIETKDVVNTAVELYEKYVKEYGPENVMILSPQHNRNGVDQINLLLQQHNSNDVVYVPPRTKRKFKKDDRVIQLKNDKKLKIHNGDQGRVVGAFDKGIEVLFDGAEEETEISDFDNIELAYSITVHKSQGSESDIVIMLFNKSHIFTLSNKLIYTALTRTKQKFIAIGDKDVFFRGCRKEDAMRTSLIARYVNTYDELKKKEKKKQTDDSWIDEIDWFKY